MEAKSFCYRTRKGLLWFLSDAVISFSFDDIMMMMTIFVLFGDDIRILAFPKSADFVFEILDSVCMFSFLLELILNSLVRSVIEWKSFFPIVKGYAFSFFWYCDIAAIISLVPDINWIASPLGIGHISSSMTGTSNYRKAGRVVRLVRLVRLIRIFKISIERYRKKKQEESLMELVKVGEVDLEEVRKQQFLNETRASKLGSELSSVITQRVIILVISMLVFLPLLSTPVVDNSPYFGTSFIHNVTMSNNLTNQTKWALIESYVDLMRARPNLNVIRLEIHPFHPGYVINYEKEVERLRSTAALNVEYESVNPLSGTIHHTIALFDLTPEDLLSAEYSIILTVFVALMLIMGSLSFTGDAQRLVLTPIEKMMNLVEMIAKDPLNPLQLDTPSLEQLEKKQKYRKKKLKALRKMKRRKEQLKRRSDNDEEDCLDLHYVDLDDSEEDEDCDVEEVTIEERKRSFSSNESRRYLDFTGEYETKLLESTIAKITSLLRVGFGEAGAGIISSNLNFQESSFSSGTSMVINPLMPGLRVYAIFGFCDIHHFEEINRCLGNDVLSFVNSIASIVHENTHLWRGQCNKNLGNAFVIVWRIGDEESLLQKLYGSSSWNSAVNPFVSSPEFSRVSTAKIEEHAGHGNKLEESGQMRYFGRRGNQLDLRKVPGIDILADSALISYLKIIVDIHRESNIKKYQRDSRLVEFWNQKHSSMECANFGDCSRTSIHDSIHSSIDELEDCNASRVRDKNITFPVSMGFGLHAGWAIEGAVGSLWKVDATYLSPHVNLAARLETASKQYGVPLLLSGEMHSLMSPSVQEKCRRLDVVTVKGSLTPITLYTYDCLTQQDFLVPPKPLKKARNSIFKSPSRASIVLPNAHFDLAHRTYEKVENNDESFADSNEDNEYPCNFRIDSCAEHDVDIDNSASDNHVRVRFGSNDCVEFRTSHDSSLPLFFASSIDDPAEAFDFDVDLVMLRRHITQEFSVAFDTGVQRYLQGDWNTARELLEKADKLLIWNNESHFSAVVGDLPSQTLLSYMQQFGYQAPSDWKGFRPLTNK